jgi:hypothetical protein
MKTPRILLLTAALLSLALSCTKPEEEVVPEIIVSPESLNDFVTHMLFEAEPSSQFFYFTATAPWSASPQWFNGESDWVTLEPSSGDAGAVNMKVTVKANTKRTDRRAGVNIKCGTAAAGFYIYQHRTKDQ